MEKFPILKYPILPITNEETYLKYCDWIEEISDLNFIIQGEQDLKYFYIDTLATLIEAYEEKQFHFNKINLSLPEIIQEALEQLNLSKKDLAKLIGSNRVSEIFKGKRQLSLSQIRILHKKLHIPTDILVGV